MNISSKIENTFTFFVVFVKQFSTTDCPDKFYIQIHPEKDTVIQVSIQTSNKHFKRLATYQLKADDDKNEPSRQEFRTKASVPLTCRFFPSQNKSQPALETSSSTFYFTSVQRADSDG